MSLSVWRTVSVSHYYDQWERFAVIIKAIILLWWRCPVVNTSEAIGEDERIRGWQTPPTEVSWLQQCGRENVSCQRIHPFMLTHLVCNTVKQKSCLFLANFRSHHDDFCISATLLVATVISFPLCCTTPRHNGASRSLLLIQTFILKVHIPISVTLPETSY
jgi:hypothetical protein